MYMEKVKIYYDSEMDTLDIWFDNPPEKGFSREISDGVILKYNLDGKLIGVEILFLSKQRELPVEIRDIVKKILREFTDVTSVIA